MAAHEKLDAIVGQYEPKSEKPERRPFRDVSPPKLMQHAHVKQDDEVRFTAGKQRKQQPEYRNNVSQVGGKDGRNAPDKTSLKTEHDGRTGEAIDGQTQVLKTQAIATQKQSGMLAQQTGLMQDQIRATSEVSDVVKRLAEYLKKEASKPVPKTQDFNGGGNTYEGEFSRVDDKKARRNAITDELRESRRNRAKKMPRDSRGRFEKMERKMPKKFGSPKMQKIGGLGGRLGGMGGRLMGAGAIGPLLALATAFYGGKVIEAASDNFDYDRKKAGTISHGYQSGKDWLSDRFRSDDPGDQVLDRMTASTKVEGQEIGKKARGGDLGSISAAFESGGRGVGTISTGKGDNGGVSYGKHQLATNNGSMTNFLRSEEGQKYYNDFRGLKAGSKEFNDKYTEVTKRDGEGMEKAQGAYNKKQNYDPVASWFTEQYDVDLEKRSRALKEVVYSIGTQYGPSTGKRVIADALGNRDVAGMDDADVISRLQDTRAATVSERFRSSDSKTKDSIYRRAGTEKAAALAMLNEEKAGPGSAAKDGSGIGAQYSQKMIGEYGGKTSGGSGGGGASNGTVGIMAMPQGGSGGGTGGAGGDEAGGGTAAGMLSPADGAFYAAGQKATIPNGSDVNLAGLNQKFKQAWYTMVGDWVTNQGGTVVNVASAFRTRMEQEQLWVKYGRDTKRVARPGTSRHESGFAIDIDRKSAQSLETTGMFKKYGFHRPLSNEPWHVELIGAGGGKGGGGGGTEVSSGGQSPQLMQAAAAKEMDKAAEVTVKSAEENTKGAIPSQGTTGDGTGIAKPESESKATQATGNALGAKEAANEAVATAAVATAVAANDKAAADATKTESKDFSVEKGNVPATVDVMGDKAVTRTPEQQAAYEQQLKSGAPASGTDWKARADKMRALGNGGGTTAPAPGGGGGYGRSAKPVQSATTRKITGAITRIGQIEGIGSFGTMAPGVDKALRKVDAATGGLKNKIFGKNPYMRELGRALPIPNIPRLASGLPSFGNIVNGVADAATGFFGGGGPSEKGVTTYSNTDHPKVMGSQSGLPPGMKATPTGGFMQSTAEMFGSKAPVESPASSSYYANETPIQTSSAATPATAMSAVTSTPVAAPAERNSFDGVQKVAMVSGGDTAPSGGGAAPSGGGGGGGGGKAGDKNDMPQLDDVPAMIDDLGLLFINSGYV
jgi:hypothetical protein